MIAQFKHRAYKQAISDRLSGTSSEARIPDGGRTERIFNRTMFVVMGKLAKLERRTQRAIAELAVEEEKKRMVDA